MENILQNYQCGSVYKPIYKETQDAVSIATIVRAGQNPSALINGTTSPPPGKTGNTQPASLLIPTWVTASNMQATVIADHFVSASTICTAVGASVCSAAGITP
jgi:D-xylose transport system substrate-binding protein